MKDFVVSVGFLKVVRFKNGYSLTYSNNIVSNRQLANYLRMNKMNLRIIANKYNAMLYEEETREISYFSDVIDAVECIKELINE